MTWEGICDMEGISVMGGDLCHGRGSVTWERICVMGGDL